MSTRRCYLSRMRISRVRIYNLYEVFKPNIVGFAEFWDEMSKKYPTQVNERELFLAKQTETVSATQIRGNKAVNNISVSVTLRILFQVNAALLSCTRQSPCSATSSRRTLSSTRWCMTRRMRCCSRTGERSRSGHLTSARSPWA